MNRHTPLIIGSIAAVLVASPILAQQQPRGGGLPPQCREEIMALCGQDRTQMRGCLREKADQLSEGCRGELRQRFEERQQLRQQRSGAPATPAPSPAPEPPR
jgi:hypothetical protein